MESEALIETVPLTILKKGGRPSFRDEPALSPLLLYGVDAESRLHHRKQSDDLLQARLQQKGCVYEKCVDGSDSQIKEAQVWKGLVSPVYVKHQLDVVIL